MNVISSKEQGLYDSWYEYLLDQGPYKYFITLTYSVNEISKEEYKSRIRHLFNFLNKSLYGNVGSVGSRKKSGKYVKGFLMHEYKAGLYHCHFLITHECLEGVSNDLLKIYGVLWKVNKQNKKMFPDVDVQAVYGQAGIVSYVLKQKKRVVDGDGLEIIMPYGLSGTSPILGSLGGVGHG